MRALLIASVALLVVGCKAKLSGDIQADGAPFSVKECRNGAALGFAGLQLTDTGGRVLRISQFGDGRAVVAIFAPGKQIGDRLGVCGTIQESVQHSTINSVHNVMGSLSLHCDAVGHHVSGKLQFENCH